MSCGQGGSAARHFSSKRLTYHKRPFFLKKMVRRAKFQTKIDFKSDDLEEMKQNEFIAQRIANDNPVVDLPVSGRSERWDIWSRGERVVIDESR